jgi:D-serine deaminase-like pyridoxal phosphate-dependent protein
MKFSWSSELDLTNVASPGLLIDVDCLASNVESMLAIVGGDASRLRPHVKTHKMSRVIQMQREAGIDQFKVATLAEARMVAEAGGRDVLIAYQMVGPNVERFAKLLDSYPATRFATVVDHPEAVASLSSRFTDGGHPLSVMIDVDCGMHRTGIVMGPALEQLRAQIDSSVGLRYAGLHVYDGHLHDPSVETRRAGAEAIFEQLRRYDREHPSPCIVGGGSPTFALWAEQTPWQCSPGTTLFWDTGYGSCFPDLPFRVGLALVTRVISKPGTHRVCLDLGYKSIAAEMPLEKRVVIPDIPDAQFLGQSEEHLVVATSQADTLSLGHALLAYPRHVCPTVALHEFATVVRDGRISGEKWKVDARGR